MQDAGNRFDALYDQQRERLAGFYARLGRGLCCKDLGESEKAFAIFEELLSLPDDPADFHTLRGKAAVQALETSLRPEVKKYKQGLDIARAVAGGRSPLRESAASGEVDLAIRFLGGEAALAYAKTLPAASPEQSGLADPADRLGAAAVQHRGRGGGAVSGEGQDSSARSGIRPCPDERTGNLCRRPQSCQGGLGPFARRPGRAERGRTRAAPATIRDAQRQRQQQIATAQSEALKYCRLAMDLCARARSWRRKNMTAVRYYLAYLHYASGELDEAAALGEALAQASSDSPAARQAARIGLAAREALLRRATDAVAADGRRAIAGPGRKDHPALGRSCGGR